MWIFTKHGFYSVVKKDCGEDELLVRSRQKADLLRLGKKLGIEVPIQDGVGSDYRYRTVLKKVDLAKYLTETVSELDYDNFKAMLPKCDLRRHAAYFGCWEALLSLQETSPKRKADNNLDRGRIKQSKRRTVWET